MQQLALAQEERTFADKRYVSFPIVQSLLHSNGFSANQNSVAIAFDEMRAEMENHQLGSRHNRHHPLIDLIKDQVSL